MSSEKYYVYHFPAGLKHSIKCDKAMELVAVVNSINPGMNSKTDSEILSQIQQVFIPHHHLFFFTF